MAQIKFKNGKAKLGELKAWEDNPRVTDPKFEGDLKSSLDKFGLVEVPVINTDNTIVAGHQRIGKLIDKYGPDLEIDIRIPDRELTPEEFIEYALISNKVSARFDYDKVRSFGDIPFRAGFEDWELDRVDTELPKDITEQAIQKRESHRKLKDRFIVPPFSVWNAQQGYWQERKRDWLGLGIQSEEGRTGDLLNMSSAALFQRFGSYENFKKFKAENEAAYSDWSEKYDGGHAYAKGGTSVFDPVTCEICYTWFCPEEGYILDPFAGGSVRAVVASTLGFNYDGIELREEQIKANREQVKDIADPNSPKPRYFKGNALNLDKLKLRKEYDFIFTCPPYYDLEQYSDNPEDLSNLSWEEFKEQYALIIHKACNKLKPQSFAVFTVGDIRDKKGAYRDLIGLTVNSFLAAGLEYYNSAVYCETAISAGIRAARIFNASRKLIKTHQNVLIFFKGEISEIKQKFPPFDFELPEEEEGDLE